MRCARVVLLLCSVVALSVVGLAEETPEPELLEPPFGQPAVITSVGQSAGALMANVLAQQAGIDSAYDQRAEVEMLEGAQTLILVLGSSAKGLGEAGVSLRAEEDWAQGLIDRARELDMAIVAMHIEGSSRRGTLSDQLIERFAPQADYMVITVAGDEDGFLTGLSEDHAIPMVRAEARMDLVPVLVELFGLEEEDA